MSEDNPQDVQTPGTPAPKEAGEIGWPANFSAPGDASLQGVATAAPTIVEGVLVAADGSPLEVVQVVDAPVPEYVEPAPVEPESEPVVEAEPEAEPEVQPEEVPAPTSDHKKKR